MPTLTLFVASFRPLHPANNLEWAPYLPLTAPRPPEEEEGLKAEESEVECRQQWPALGDDVLSNV